MSNREKVTYFAETDARGRHTKFGIKQDDRSRHVYVIGKTGMGKSTLLENLAVQDIQGGEGIAFIDPHGKTADLLLEYVPEERIKDVMYFAPFDIDNPVAFNVMEDIGPDKRHLVASGLLSIFKKVFGEESFSDRMQYMLQNTILALLEYPGATLLDINRMLSDKAFRNDVISKITDPSVNSYWTKEYAGYTERFAAEAIPAIQNKIGQFTSNPLIRNIVGQQKSSFDLREMMDEQKIIIINLSKGQVGESNANLLGSMFITKMYLAAMSRADADGAGERPPIFYLFVDEFQSFANESFADILSEARKYGLALTIAHQYIEQMSEEVRAAVFGNVGTMISFRVGAYDADVLEKEFAPKFTAEDLVNLGFVQIYLKLMIDGISSQPFSARTLPPIEKAEQNFKEQVIQSSRAQFTETRAEVEKRIQEIHASEPKLEKESRPSDKKPQRSKNKPPRTPDMKQEKNPFADLVVGKDGALGVKNEKQTVPLSSLEKKPKQKKQTRDASKQRVNELKNALSSVLANPPAEKKTEPAKSQPKSEAKPQSKSQPKPKKEPVVSKKEIPADELKKVLGS